ncbi:uncharacterized protein LOC119665438 [Teleopsis dalmanni]|nr:uncharacterized protein LOC119665438 [Teleopsis dalmanni]
MLLMAEHRANHFDELLYYYFTHFTETLKKIGYNGRIPKLMELREQLLRHRHNAIYMLTTFLPFWYAYTLKKVDPDELMSAKDDSRDVLYTNKDYIKELHTILPRYLELGYLEN